MLKWLPASASWEKRSTSATPTRLIRYGIKSVRSRRDRCGTRALDRGWASAGLLRNGSATALPLARAIDDRIPATGRADTATILEQRQGKLYLQQLHCQLLFSQATGNLRAQLRPGR